MTLANLWDAGTPKDQRADPCLAAASPACPAAPLKSGAGQLGTCPAPVVGPLGVPCLATRP